MRRREPVQIIQRSSSTSKLFYILGSIIGLIGVVIAIAGSPSIESGQNYEILILGIVVFGVGALFVQLARFMNWWSRGML